MLGDAPGNSAFDIWFLLLELLALGLSLGLALFTKHWPVSALWPTWTVGALIVVVMPVLWYLILPPQPGLDGAGRLMFVVPMTAVNLGALIFAAARIVKSG
jgi:hypothetical protein